ncbi:hypothetical protein BpHYR1_042325 [Brachionus plicatilis]|uniref:Uncharacterized protein n=1 Tax=Brachionus plicatilis TaxID=10195 RepID=A0A3M7SV46_BRAPC|nr:hypothetical protein BpHYR1_042325 [Brachionus plicatilis]
MAENKLQSGLIELSEQYNQVQSLLLVEKISKDLEKLETENKKILKKQQENKVFILGLECRLKNIEEQVRVNQVNVNMVPQTPTTRKTALNFCSPINYLEQMKKISTALEEISETIKETTIKDFDCSGFQNNLVQILIMLNGICIIIFCIVASSFGFKK